MKLLSLFLIIIALMTFVITIKHNLDLKEKSLLGYQKQKNSETGVIMPTQDSLKKYKEKRDFTKTPEPKAKVTKKHTQPIFCVQEHHASHLHWDFRLEIDGVMPSWAIPKGPSTDPKVKRLAMQTENHPVSYASFEGIIPEGEYGGGTVMVWDYGTYKNMREKDGKIIPMDKCLKEGRIEIFLEGKKLQGIYILVRFKDSEKEWLFFKKNDEYADARKNITKSQNKSALTNRTITQIKRNVDEKNSSYKEYV